MGSRICFYTPSTHFLYLCCTSMRAWAQQPSLPPALSDNRGASASNSSVLWPSLARSLATQRGPWSVKQCVRSGLLLTCLLPAAQAQTSGFLAAANCWCWLTSAHGSVCCRHWHWCAMPRCDKATAPRSSDPPPRSAPSKPIPCRVYATDCPVLLTLATCGGQSSRVHVCTRWPPRRQVALKIRFLYGL